METEGSTQRVDDKGQEAVTTMVNYVAATTWWHSANGRDGEKEILLRTRSVFPQPEDA